MTPGKVDRMLWGGGVPLMPIRTFVTGSTGQARAE